MNGNRSVATIDAPEFINLREDALNPGISQCEIKVLYLGKNRNGSFVDKLVAKEMANTLPGTPIVGAYREDIEDFGDHGHVMHMEDGEIKFSCKTRPYGFVAPDAKAWFQKFVDTDEFGNEIEREYLMTNGYLWTDQYPEVKACVEGGKGQSMELDPEKMEGHWATDNNSGIEFFIINDAVFSKLCILGDDVEPCFEGAAVTGPEVSKNFSANKEFSQTLFTMMNELKDALESKGGLTMLQAEETPIVENSLEEAPVVEDAAVEEPVEEVVEEEPVVEEEAVEEEAAEEVSEEEPVEEPVAEPVEEEAVEETPVVSEEEFTALQAAHAELQTQYAALEEELESLREFKKAQENIQKDELINKYYMLSEEDKADVVAHKEEYSLDEIEGKLALIYVQKNVDFSTTLNDEEDQPEVQEDPLTTFSLDTPSEGFVPELVQALRNNCK